MSSYPIYTPEGVAKAIKFLFDHLNELALFILLGEAFSYLSVSANTLCLNDLLVSVVKVNNLLASINVLRMPIASFIYDKYR